MAILASLICWSRPAIAITFTVRSTCSYSQVINWAGAQGVSYPLRHRWFLLYPRLSVLALTSLLNLTFHLFSSL